MTNSDKCDFRGDNVTLPFPKKYGVGQRLLSQHLLKFRGFSSETHSDVYNQFLNGELFWDISTETLFYKDHGGELWKVNFKKVEIESL